MICMAALAPRGIFEESEDREWIASLPDAEPETRHFDNYSRNWEESPHRCAPSDFLSAKPVRLPPRPARCA